MALDVRFLKQNVCIVLYYAAVSLLSDKFTDKFMLTNDKTGVTKFTSCFSNDNDRPHLFQDRLIIFARWRPYEPVVPWFLPTNGILMGSAIFAGLTAVTGLVAWHSGRMSISGW